MSKKSELWFGMLEAGEKSSPVVRCPKHDTGKSDTVYLYNQKRDTIIEYKREIVEPKLRELNKSEESLIKELTTAYNKAVKGFSPRGGKGAASTEAEPSEKKESRSSMLKMDDDYNDGDGDDFDLDDDD